MKRVIRIGTGILVLAILGWWTFVRGMPGWHARELTPVLEEYMRAAERGDSVTLANLSASPQPASWGMTVHRSHVAFATEASMGLRPSLVEDQGSVTMAVFALHRDVTDSKCEFRPLREVQARFIRQGSEWRLVWVGTDPC